MASSALSGLATANGYVTLGLTVAGVAIPLVKGLITDIKQVSSSGGSVTYQVVLQADEASIANSVSVSVADLMAINAELTRLNTPTLQIPPAPTA
jgi:hypothetical protein